MKKLALASLISIASFNLYANAERDAFVDQLSVENCSKTPASIYIDTDSKEFDIANVLSYSWISLQTLDSDPTTFEDDADADLEAAKANWGLKNVRMIDNDKFKVRTMIAEYEDVVLVTFRHTTSNLNWAMNADFGLWNFDHSFTFGQKVHHGFGSMLGSMWDEIVADLKVRAANGKKVSVFGHSLGASLALLAGPGLAEEGFNVVHVYSTGSPKVGSVEWTASAKVALGETPVYRVTNADDLIARVPLAEEALDEFRQVFAFVPGFVTRSMDRLRPEMPFGLLGDNVQLNKDGSIEMEIESFSAYKEEVYWKKVAGTFAEIDSSSANLIDNLNKKAQVISTNLSDHLMRKAPDGYTCNIIKNLKSAN